MALITKLPNDIIEHTLSYLTDFDIYNFTITCKNAKLRKDRILDKMQQYRKYLFKYAIDMDSVLKARYINTMRPFAARNHKLHYMENTCCLQHTSHPVEEILQRFNNSMIIPDPIYPKILEHCEKEIVEFKVTSDEEHWLDYDRTQCKDIYKVEFNGTYSNDFRFHLIYNTAILLTIKKITTSITDSFNFLILHMKNYEHLTLNVIGFNGVISIHRTKHECDSYKNLYYKHHNKYPEFTFIPVIIYDYFCDYVPIYTLAVIIETLEPITSIQINGEYTVDKYMIEYIWQRVSKKVRPVNHAIIMLSNIKLKTNNMRITYNNGLQVKQVASIYRNLLLTHDNGSVVFRYCTT